MNVTTEQIFTEARTENGFLPQAVPDALLHELYDLLKWGPTSANSSPARFLFVRTPEMRARLAGCVGAGNVDKVLRAPVTVVIGMDMEFYDRLPGLFPHTDARAWFAGNPEMIQSTAFRNSSMQGAYLIVAARALGLDCGPMSGFDANKVNALFWDDTSIRVNFLCTLGFGDPDKVHARNPRLDFEQACSLI